MAPHSSTLAWKIPWTEEPGGLQSMGSRSRTQLSDFTFTFHLRALEKEMVTHSSVLAWRIPGTGKPSGLPSIGSHKEGHDWSDLAVYIFTCISFVVVICISLIISEKQKKVQSVGTLVWFHLCKIPRTVKVVESERTLVDARGPGEGVGRGMGDSWLIGTVSTENCNFQSTVPCREGTYSYEKYAQHE